MEIAVFAWPMVILLGLGLRMAMRLIYGARGPDRGDSPYTIAMTGSWVLLILGLFPILFFGTLSFIGLLFVLLGAATVVEYVVARRAAQRRSMCKLLALTIQRGAPLEPSVLLAGQTFGGSVGISARTLLYALGNGATLPEAIGLYPGALPLLLPTITQ